MKPKSWLGFLRTTAAIHETEERAYGYTLAEWVEAAGGIENPQLAGIEFRAGWRAGEDPAGYLQ